MGGLIADADVRPTPGKRGHAGAGTIDLGVEDMTCAPCAGRVERALKRVPLRANDDETATPRKFTLEGA